MFLWIVGLMTNMSLLLLTIGSNTFLVTFPLWSMCLIFTVSATKDPFNDNVDIFAVVSFCVALFTTLNLSNVMNTLTTIVLLSIIFVMASALYLVRNQPCQYDLHDKFVRISCVAELVSKLSFFAGFVLFYSAEVGSTQPWLPLIPSFLFLLSEGVVVYTYKFRRDQNDQFRETKRFGRLLNVVAIFIFIVLLTMHVAHVVSNVTLYTFGMVVYISGILFIRRKEIYKIMTEFKQQSNTQRLTAVNQEYEI